MKHILMRKIGLFSAFILSYFMSLEIIHRDIQFVSLRLIGEPVRLALNLLANLSLSSSIGNVFAWLLFGVLSMLPYLCLRLLRFKQSEHPLSYWVSLLMGLFIAVAVYGSLNFSFIVPPLSLSLELQTQMHASLITVSLFLFIAILVLSLQWPIQEEKQLIRLFQSFLWLIAYVCMALMGVLSATVLNSTFKLFQPSWFNALSSVFAQLLPSLLLLRLIPSLTELLHHYEQDGFSNQLLPLLEKITKLNTQAVYGMFLIPLLYNLFQLLLFTSQRSANFVFTFPWIEMVLAITILFVMHLLRHAVNIQRENEGFV